MSTEKSARARSGWGMVPIVAAIYVVGVALAALWVGDALASLEGLADKPGWLIVAEFVASCALLGVAVLLTCGFFALEPGQAKVCVLFGTYVGTIRESGFYWANPFFAKYLSNPDAPEPEGPNVTAYGEVEVKTPGATKANRGLSTKVSVRARTLTGQKIKVNDRMGNPIEIASVVVWHVEDTARALFDVDNYPSFVDMQAETALRQVASLYAYDHMEDDDASNTSITLRSNIEEVSESLKDALNVRLAPAGALVDDVRLTHLAYAPEIASAMLRRQQAEAVIAARKKIVEGAVSMVDMALTQLSDGGVVEFDDDRKAVMASNLMVVLCGESEAQPVLNTGSLYQ